MPTLRKHSWSCRPCRQFVQSRNWEDDCLIVVGRSWLLYEVSREAGWGTEEGVRMCFVFLRSADGTDRCLRLSFWRSCQRFVKVVYDFYSGKCTSYGTAWICLHCWAIWPKATSPHEIWPNGSIDWKLKDRQFISEIKIELTISRNMYLWEFFETSTREGYIENIT